ncbi:conserved hypothetical protein [Acidithiobacillus caldus SM-1]|uniref:Uncharacterized protein n=1 Tax=Acidithiobacillus caldus (strain SM-1) TaxID=990288 RepID=F9ZRZ6_ACICS|nr:hypothetical protein [Acidithiobacillus caldus]AEK58780.1 conserved hypothetical protein [Acidithiobacillus caldus SM-1]
MLKMIQISVLVDTNAIDGPFPKDFSGTSALEVMELLSNPKRRRLESGRRVPVVLDSRVEDQGEVVPELEDAIVNDTYYLQEAFTESVVVASPNQPAPSRFWAEDYGWADQNRATRYRPLKSEMPDVYGDPEYCGYAAFLDAPSIHG